MECVAFSIASIVISIVSIVISLIFSVFTCIQTKKINNINIKSKYYAKIFDKYLIYKIPNARDYLRFNEEGKLDDYSTLLDVICKMRNSAQFFKYDNREFYNKLKEVTQALEDTLVLYGNKAYENDEQADAFKDISDKTNAIYKCISDNYLG